MKRADCINLSFFLLCNKTNSMKNLFYLLVILLASNSCKKETFSDNTNPDKYYQKAKNFRNLNITDSAFVYYNLAKNDYLKNQDSTGAAKSLVNMAIIQTSKGDYFGSIETSLEANKLLKNIKDSTVKSTIASSYNNMAISSSFLKNFKESSEYYIKALHYANVDENKYVYYNNIGDVLLLQGNGKMAQKYLQKAVLAKDSNNYSMALNNLAKAKLLENKNYNPLPELYKALEIRYRNNDTRGLNSSFATLSDYFTERDKEKSLSFAIKLLNTAREIKISDDKIEALQRIINLDPKNYLKNFKEYKLINDSLQTARNKAKNQFAVIRYDVEAKNAENQKLKLQDAEKEVDILKRNIGLGILSIILIGGFFWYRKRKKRLQQENELKIKNNQLKLSKKVHDVVANGIYQVITKIENQENIDKNEMLDELEFVYEKSRDISYEKIDSKEDEEDFSKKISKLIATFKNETVNTYVAGNDETIWKDVKSSNQEEVYQIIRELLVNMKKHSRADRVVLKFERINNFITIHYTDNGVGISGELIYKNGLTSTVSRIENVRGEIIFDTEIEKGLKITISFPI